MAYNSAHTGPEIDAAVEMLSQVQDARDATKSDLIEVRSLASEVDDNAIQVAEQAATVATKSEQVSSKATAVELAHAEVMTASASAVEAMDESALSASSALASKDAASASQSAASQSQLAAGLSEQLSAENAASTSADRQAVSEKAQQVALDSASAAESAQSAAAVVTGGTATFASEPGKIPLANGQGKIDTDWLGDDVARTDAVLAATELAQAAEDAADVATNRTAGFLQPAAEAPVVRDDGLPLQVGDRYFNTEDQTEYLYKSGAWVANDSLAAIAELEASITVESSPNNTPKGDAEGKLAEDWFPDTLARTAVVESALDGLGSSIQETISTHERLSYRKRLAFSLPLIHPEFDYLYSLGTRFYPQTLVVDETAGKLLLIDGVEPSRTVLVYDWPSGNFDRMFFLSATLVSEGAVIKVESGVKYLYVRSTGDRLARYDITTYPAARSTLAPAAFSTSVVAGLCLTYRNGRWTLGDTAVDYTGLRSRGRFALFDDSFAVKGSLDLGRWQLGIYAGQDGDTSMTKTQGICDTGYGIVACMGGQQLAANAESPYGSIGTRTFNYDGKMIGEALCTSAGLRAVLTSAYGLSPTLTEAEGIVCLSNGEVYSLIVTNGWGDAAAATQGMTILQEFDSRGADFSAAAIPRSQSLGDFGTLTTTPSGNQLVNFASPTTPVTTVTQLIAAMVQSGLKVFEWRPDQISILDVSGVAYASGQTKARLEVFDSTRAYVTVTGFNYYYRARIRNTSGVWDEQQVSEPVHTQQYAFDGTKAGDLSFRNYNNDSLSLRMVNTSGTGILASLGTSGARMPNVYGVNGNFSGPVNIGAYTLTTLPSASAYPNALILVTNATGGAKWCMSNSSVWQIINSTDTVS